jgi:hypothetical protein
MTITEQIKHAATETTAPPNHARYLCRHVHADGRRCGSRALRRQNFCYYHTANRPPVQNPRLRKQERNEFALSDPADRTALQITLGEVLRRIASNEIDPRRAGLLLYGLQIASGNIPKPKSGEMPSTVEEVVEDPELGLIAPEEEAAPFPWTDDEWRKKHKREELHLEINRKLVEECDARISELEKAHAQEHADLKYEVQCLRSVRDPNPALKSIAEKNLEELRVKRENAAKQLTDSAAESHTQDVETVTHPAQVIPSINGSAHSSATRKGPAHKRRLHKPVRVKLLAHQRSQSQPPRKSVSTRRRALCI